MHVPADSAAQPAVGAGTPLRQLDSFEQLARAPKRQKVWVIAGLKLTNGLPVHQAAPVRWRSDREARCFWQRWPTLSGAAISLSRALKAALACANAGAGSNEGGHKAMRALRTDQNRAMLHAGQHDFRWPAPSLPHVRRRQAAAHGIAG